jgi:DNA-binding ferritin-like protein (Dps family)
MNVIVEQFMVIEEINFLVENNYADSEKAASKILEAASDEFKDYILQEVNKQWLKKQALKLTKTAAKSALKSKPAKAVGRFLKYTALGGLVP